jgi:hypothetical protein
VADPNAGIAKLRAARVTFLEQRYKMGALRPVMIDRPSSEPIELVEGR